MEKKHVASEQVFNYIEDKIYSQEWIPGMKIASENQLSAELGISRMSVREAIEKMVALNVLTKKQGEGTFVNDLTPGIYLNKLIPLVILNPDNLLEVLEFRLVMEPESARLCAERCDEETIKILEECHEVMEAHNNTSDEFAKADYRLHMEIAKGSKNSLIIKVNSVLTNIWEHQQKELNKHLGPRRGVIEHKPIIDAIKAGDGELAALYMKRHVMRTYLEIKSIVQNEQL